MKQIRQKNDKAVSPIIATILLIAITVVLAATLVTILGGFTHGVSNTVVTTTATTSEFKYSSTSPTTYTVYLNITASSTNLTASSVTLEINGAVVGALSSGNSTFKVTGPNYVNSGSNFKITTNSGAKIYKITSVDLLYKGVKIYQSGSISIS